MAEEAVLEQEQKTETVDVSTILQNAAFGDNEPSQQNNTDAKEVSETTNSEEVKTGQDEEILEPKEWLKRELDVDDVSILKAEREELKSAKEKLKKFEIDENGFKVLDYLKPENEDKLFEFLSNKKKVEKLSKADLTDKNIAAELVKFGIKNENPSLLDDEVEFLFNEKYSIPSKPVQGELEGDDDYSARLSSWEIQKSTIEKRMVIDAKIAQPKIAELNTGIALPNIEREIPSAKEPSPEEVAAFKLQKDAFIQEFNNVSKDFSGFAAQVKNKDVDYNVAYTPSQEEKNLISQKMQVFAESGFDANALFADEWVNSEGKINVQKMTEDLSRMFMGKNVEAKIANEAANKRMELYLQSKKQIDITETNEEGKLQLDKGNETVEDKLRERMLQLT